MKTLVKKLSILLILLFAALFFSCEKDLYEEPLRKKERPNLQVEMKPVNRNSEVINKLRKKLPSKFIISDNARGGESLLTLEGDFGKVKLESVLEVANQNEKSYSFEVDETVKDPNKYLNLVIDKNDVIWLYKVEKLAQQYKNYPINSERLVKYKLNSDLTLQSSTPCDTIVYPPFQPDPINNPSNGVGGITTFPGGSNWQNNPPGGGFFPPIINPGGSSGSSGSSGSPGSGSNGVYEVIVAVGDAISDAWNWLINLFSSPPKPQSSGCGCKLNVVIVAHPDNPCGPDGYIAIIPQSPIIDKINELDVMLFDQLTYDDKMYLHNEGLAYLDFFYNLAQNPPVSFNPIDVLPPLIKHLRVTGDFEFVEEVIELMILNPELTFEQATTINIVENLSNEISGDPVELYLILKYKHSSLLNASAYSSAGNSISVGSYTLTPHYSANGTLVYYTAARYSTTTGVPINSIEYIIKPSGLTNFQDKIDLYTAAANLFYMNGIPSQGQIAMAAGDYVTGLKDMWADALTDPQYYVYLAHIFVGCATNLNAVQSTSTSFEGKIKFTSSTQGSSIQNITINNRSATQYKQLISNKFPNATWETHPSPNVDQILISGNIKYVGRFENNSGFYYVIDYYRNGILIGKFRFNY